MNNYNTLLSIEKDLKFIKNGLLEEDLLFIDKLELLHCLYVVNIHSGEMGYIKRDKQGKLSFFVPLTENETPISIDELNDNYIQTPKHILNMEIDNPRFILSPYSDSAGVVAKTNHEERIIKVVWKDYEENLDTANIYWITKIVGVKRKSYGR